MTAPLLDVAEFPISEPRLGPTLRFAPEVNLVLGVMAASMAAFFFYVSDMMIAAEWPEWRGSLPAWLAAVADAPEVPAQALFLLGAGGFMSGAAYLAFWRAFATSPAIAITPAGLRLHSSYARTLIRYDEMLGSYTEEEPASFQERLFGLLSRRYRLTISYAVPGRRRVRAIHVRSIIIEGGREALEAFGWKLTACLALRGATWEGLEGDLWDLADSPLLGKARTITIKPRTSAEPE